MRTNRQSLVDVVADLPDDPQRGATFIDADGSEHFHSFPSLRVEAYRVAQQMRAYGLNRGARVGLVLPRHEDFLFGFLGAALAGYTVVPIASRVGASPKSREAYEQTVTHILRASEADLVLVDGASAPLAQQACARRELRCPLQDIGDLKGGDFSPTPPEPLREEDMCLLQFTSGSTSMPKGVIVTHGNVISNADAFLGPAGSIAYRDGDLALGWLPFYHDMGLMCFALGPLVVQMPTVMFATELFGSAPRTWMKMMSGYGASITFAPNFAYEMAARICREKDLAELELSRFRVAGCGAEPINPKTMYRFMERFEPAGFKRTAMVPCYGMAEATVAIAFHPHEEEMVVDRVDAAALREGRAVPVGARDEDATEIVSCGVAVTDHEIAIHDREGNSLPERRVGEICFRGRSVTPGYFMHPDATAKTYREGWLHSGDLGYLADGNLYVCGRIKDVVIANGVNYYPQDIEWAVCDACGIGPNRVVAFSVIEQGLEKVVVCLEPRGGEDASRIERTVLQAVECRVGLHVHQVVVLQRGELTLTSSGKVQRRKTKLAFERGQLKLLPPTLERRPGLRER